MERVAERRTPSGGSEELTVSTKPDAPRGRYPAALWRVALLTPYQKRLRRTGAAASCIPGPPAYPPQACCSRRPRALRHLLSSKGGSPKVAREFAIIADRGRRALSARSPPAAASVAGHAPFPCGEVGSGYGRFRYASGGDADYFTGR